MPVRSAGSWTVIMVRKGPGMVSDDVRHTLETAAYKLTLDRQDKNHFKSRTCEGYLETGWRSVTVGTRTGILFKSVVDSGDGPFSVNFLVNSKDLDRGAEVLREIENGRNESVRVSEDAKLPDEMYDFITFSSVRSN